MIGVGNLKLDKYLLKTEAKTEYVPKGEFDIDISGIESSINLLNSDISNLKSWTNSYEPNITSLNNWTNSYEPIITSLTNNTVYFNNELYSIKTNTESMSNIIDGLTTMNNNYDYWYEFNKSANDTYKNFEIGSTIVKDEQITYNLNISNNIMNLDKKEFVFNQNILNAIFTIEQPLSRLGLKLTNTNEGLRATAENVDIAAYTNLGLYSSFNLKCKDLNIYNSGGNISNIGTNIDVSTINFNNIDSNKTYRMNFNSNVKSLINFPNSCSLYITNNGNNIFTIPGTQTIYFDNIGVLNNFVFDNSITISKNNGTLKINNITTPSVVYLSANSVSHYTLNNCSIKTLVAYNTVDDFYISSNTIRRFLYFIKYNKKYVRE